MDKEMESLKLLGAAKNIYTHQAMGKHRHIRTTSLYIYIYIGRIDKMAHPITLVSGNQQYETVISLIEWKIDGI